MVKLLRLLKKTEVRSLVEDALSSLGGEAAILDNEGQIIFGESSDNGLSTPISIKTDSGDTYIGAVVGSEQAAFVARLIACLAQQEYEKYSVAHETLDRYKEITLLYGIAEKIATNMAPHEVGLRMLTNPRQSARVFLYYLHAKAAQKSAGENGVCFDQRTCPHESSASQNCQGY